MVISREKFTTSVLALVADFEGSRVLSSARMVGCHKLENLDMNMLFDVLNPLFIL